MAALIAPWAATTALLYLLAAAGAVSAESGTFTRDFTGPSTLDRGQTTTFGPVKLNCGSGDASTIRFAEVQLSFKKGWIDPFKRLNTQVTVNDNMWRLVDTGHREVRADGDWHTSWYGSVEVDCNGQSNYTVTLRNVDPVYAMQSPSVRVIYTVNRGQPSPLHCADAAAAVALSSYNDDYGRKSSDQRALIMTTATGTTTGCQTLDAKEAIASNFSWQLARPDDAAVPWTVRSVKVWVPSQCTKVALRVTVRTASSSFHNQTTVDRFKIVEVLSGPMTPFGGVLTLALTNSLCLADWGQRDGHAVMLTYDRKNASVVA